MLELKLELTPEEVQHVGSHPALGELTLGQPATRTLRSIYFDTPDHRLRAEGIALRLRSDGDKWLQIVKAETGVEEGVSNPIEVEIAVTGAGSDLKAIANGEVRQKVDRAVRRSFLEPVFETVMKRTTRQLRTADGELELALDEGIVRAGHAESGLCEAELKLKSGKPNCLLETATKLFSATPIRLAQSSKAERGYCLALGKIDARIEPKRAEQPHLSKGQTCAEALARILDATAAQIVTNRCAVLEIDDPEAAHQLRIGLRRLRSALRAFRPLTDTPALREFEGHTRALARKVGELRDADVLIKDIYAPVAGLVRGDPGLALLRDALLAHRARVREDVRSALRGEQWSLVQLNLALWPGTLERSAALLSPIETFARTALKKRWKKVAQYGRRLDELTLEQRHEMRKALKELRYTAEFFAPLHAGRAAHRFVKQLKRLQEVFGYLNDVTMAQRLSSLCQGQYGAAQGAAGYVFGWHSAEATHMWKDAHKGWKRLSKLPRFWT